MKITKIAIVGLMLTVGTVMADTISSWPTDPFGYPGPGPINLPPIDQCYPSGGNCQ